MPFNSFENYPMSWKPTLDKNQSVLYLALSEQLERDIRADILRPGTRLPPQRELADFLDVNVSTVKKAFRVCERRGLVSSVRGSGTFVCYDALSSARLLPEGNPEKLIELGTTVPESSANEDLAALLRSMLAEPDSTKWFSYDLPGDAEWRTDAAAALIARCGFHVSSNTVLFANGGQNALNAVLAGVFRPGDRIGADPHAFTGIKTAAAMLGIHLVPVRLKNGVMDPEGVRFAAANDGITGLYLIPTHQNPTAVTMPETCRREIARIVREKDLLVVEDGTYQLLGEQPLSAVSSFAPERSIYLTSLSKAVAPGLRMAFLSAPEPYRTLVSAQLYNLNVSVSPLMAELSARVVVSGLLDTILKKHKAVTRRRNALVDEILAGFPCNGEPTCILRWLHLPEGWTGTAFEEAARRAGVQVYAAERFAVGSSIPDRAVRLSICGPKTEEELCRGLKIVRELLAAPPKTIQ